MVHKKDYYDILGVNKSADKDEIKKAYKKLAKQYHPDLNKSADATDKFKEINEAASVLLDDNKRAQYDQFGHSFEQNFNNNGYSQGGGFNVDINDIFEQFFGDDSDFEFFGRRGGRDSKRRGADLKTRIAVTLEDVAEGVEKEIVINKDIVCTHCDGSGAENSSDIKTCHQCNGSGKVRYSRQTVFGVFSQVSTCDVCRGSGRVIKNICHLCDGNGKISSPKKINVRIPKGVDNNVTLRLNSEGDDGLNGGRNGDLYIEITVKAHDVFERKAEDLYIQKNISLFQALFGDDISIPTIYGSNSILKIPSKTESHTTFRVAGKGLPKFDSNSKGDMFVKIIVDMPDLDKFSKDDRTILKELLSKQEPQTKKSKDSKSKRIFGLFD